MSIGRLNGEHATRRANVIGFSERLEVVVGNEVSSCISTLKQASIGTHQSMVADSSQSIPDRL